MGESSTQGTDVEDAIADARQAAEKYNQIGRVRQILRNPKIQASLQDEDDVDDTQGDEGFDWGSVVAISPVATQIGFYAYMNISNSIAFAASAGAAEVEDEVAADEVLDAA